MIYEFNDELKYKVENNKITLLLFDEVIGESDYKETMSSQGIENSVLDLLANFLFTYDDIYGDFPTARFEDSFDMYIRNKKQKLNTMKDFQREESLENRTVNALNLFFGRDIRINY